MRSRKQRNSAEQHEEVGGSDEFSRVLAGEPEEPGAAGAADADSPGADAATADGTDAARPGRLRRWFSGPWTGSRLVALIAGVAVLSLLAGVVLMQFIVSPAELAARAAPPKAGPVTAPIEERKIENTVVSRGEVTYADAVDAQIDAAGLSERAVVTGQVPQSGKILKAGDIALEIAGRPVIVLAGELPAYRSMSIGQRGPDVLQLKQALTALGLSAGDTSNNVFEGDTSNAIGALYERLGYPAPVVPDSAQGATDAESGVRNAELALTQAQVTLSQAIEAKSKDVRAEQAGVDSAAAELEKARESLVKAQEAAMPTMPSAEVLFLSSLPRRVDEVRVKRGDVLQGTAMTVSGATLTVTGTVAKQDAELLSKGLPATFAPAGGAELKATVTRIDKPGTKPEGSGQNGSASADAGSGGGDSSGSGGEAPKSSDRYTVFLDPGKLTSEQIEQLRGTNVRLKIPVASTKGEVLSVPIAALSTGSGGENRVELLVSSKQNGKDRTDETATVTVKAGLAADGYVEISSSDPRIKAGAKVVVGR
ncbi:hypothetical protein [Leucobacter iarius]|uniref:hypothetical protein n=1 Tax=Leucobacter iarius TaxID=333963 RepID=UPI0031DB5478